MQWLQTVDHTVFFFFQGLQQPWLDYFLAWPTRLGEQGILLAVLIPLILIFDRKNAFRTIAALIIVLLMVSYSATIWKDFFGRPRPHLFWENVQIIFAKPRNLAFPSGHTMIIFSAAFIMGTYYPKKILWFYGIAVWVAMTRIYVGVHYLTDLIAGAFFGILYAWLVVWIFKLYAIRETEDAVSLSGDEDN
jgi:undecaprenyl-diphosphatase